MTKEEIREKLSLPPLDAETSAGASMITDAINSLSPLVANKVLESMTPNEIRALIGLGQTVGGDVAPVAAPSIGDSPEPSQAMINEHLKGMKGREWQNFQRIIREYNKGKITREQASQMLKSAYGLGEEELATWLGADEFSNDMDAVLQVFSEYGESTENYKALATRKVFSGDLEEQELKFRDEVIDDTLDKKILDVIAKNKGIGYEDIAKAVKEDVAVVTERINKLKELEVIKIDKGIPKLTKPLAEIIDKPVKTTFLVRYSYEWKSIVPTTERNTPAHPSRPFCAKLMQLDRLYSRSEIESISRRLGYSVFDRGGGWWNMGDGVNSPSCRHQWVSKVVIKKDK
jgi:hypothetical protein